VVYVVKEKFSVRCGRCRRRVAHGRDNAGRVAAGVTEYQLHRHTWGAGPPGGLVTRRAVLWVLPAKGAIVREHEQGQDGWSLSFTCACGMDYRVRYRRLVGLYLAATDAGSRDVWLDA